PPVVIAVMPTPALGMDRVALPRLAAGAGSTHVSQSDKRMPEDSAMLQARPVSKLRRGTRPQQGWLDRGYWVIIYWWMVNRPKRGRNVCPDSPGETRYERRFISR